MMWFGAALSALLLGQPTPPQAFVCNPPSDAAVAALCAAEEAMRQGDREDAEDETREAARTRAVDEFRRARNLTQETSVKRRALEQLERLFDATRLDLPREADPVLRELIALTPDDVSPMFRLAKLQERQELFDAAESTLLAAHQRKPDDLQPYRELAQYFARRAAALSANRDREARAVGVQPEADQPDKDGIYRLGGSVQSPDRTSAEAVPIPPDVIAAGITGSVGLEIVVDETGAVRDARVVRSVPLLDETALALVRRWRFTPAVLNGRPVPVRMPVVIKVGPGLDHLVGSVPPIV